MPGFCEISPTQLMRLIGTAEAPQILDVTTPEDFAADPALIPTARRAHAQSLVADPACAAAGDRPVVVICQRGGKLSHGVAAALRAAGTSAEVLEGGALGWASAGLPRLPACNLPGDGARHGTLWVTRQRPKIDRIACPWLIRRFVDPLARFLFVPARDVPEVALRFDATPFDIDGVALSHRGEDCSFDTMLAEFGLQTAPLQRMAQVIRGADTNRHDLAPECAGLLALSVGLSRAYKSDEAQLEAGMILYDALFRWARDGQSEGHDWTTGEGK